MVAFRKYDYGNCICKPAGLPPMLKGKIKGGENMSEEPELPKFVPVAERTEEQRARTALKDLRSLFQGIAEGERLAVSYDDRNIELSLTELIEIFEKTTEKAYGKAGGK